MFHPDAPQPTKIERPNTAYTVYAILGVSFFLLFVLVLFFLWSEKSIAKRYITSMQAALPWQSHRNVRDQLVKPTGPVIQEPSYLPKSQLAAYQACVAEGYPSIGVFMYNHIILYLDYRHDWDSEVAAVSSPHIISSDEPDVFVQSILIEGDQSVFQDILDAYTKRQWAAETTLRMTDFGDLRFSTKTYADEQSFLSFIEDYQTRASYTVEGNGQYFGRVIVEKGHELETKCAFHSTDNFSAYFAQLASTN